MRPLIDSDILLYEVGFAAEVGWKSDGHPPFDYVAEMLDMRIDNICAMVGATEAPTFFLTGSTNFRTEIAKFRPYKQRNSNKPWHYKNIKAYIKGKYDYRIVEGLEADDLMALEQTQSLGQEVPTIICSRDKDLRAVPGWHYGWELGRQPQYGPKLVQGIGELRLSDDRKSIKGEGLLFFYSQCLTGDSVDTVPGLLGCGPVNAFNLLSTCQTEEEAFKAVLEAYRTLHGGLAEDMLLEQGRLLWMTRQLTEEGKPVLWQFPKLETVDNGQKLDTLPLLSPPLEVAVSDGPLSTQS